MTEVVGPPTAEFPQGQITRTYGAFTPVPLKELTLFLEVKYPIGVDAKLHPPLANTVVRVHVDLLLGRKRGNQSWRQYWVDHDLLEHGLGHLIT